MRQPRANKTFDMAEKFTVELVYADLKTLHNQIFPEQTNREKFLADRRDIHALMKRIYEAYAKAYSGSGYTALDNRRFKAAAKKLWATAAKPKKRKPSHKSAK